ncbi:hypothetical protein C8T65DRAFT_832484 [Cerioporus squamosus]|nr:hypothetical protein C8T65DRAFT_832484 [Cerioporus squamosus]
MSAAAMDIFGWDPDFATAMIPLVDVWLDIDQHLKEHEIPSPLDLQKEIGQVRSIIERGLARHVASQMTPSQIIEEHPVSDMQLPVETRRTYYWPHTREAAHWKTIVGGLWRDLRDQALSDVTASSTQSGTSSSSVPTVYRRFHIKATAMLHWFS